MANAINWFEIPANNLQRACSFYNYVLNQEIHQGGAAGMEMGIFQHGPTGVGGAVVKAEGYKPSAEGALLYLNGGADLSGPLARVEKAGGKIVLPKTKISDEIGFMAIFLDTEGNRIALHSPS